MGLLGSLRYELLYGNNASDNKLGAKTYQFKKNNNKNKKATNSVVGGLFTWHPISALTLEIGSKLGFRNFTGNCLEFISSLRERLAIERKRELLQ